MFTAISLVERWTEAAEFEVFNHNMVVVRSGHLNRCVCLTKWSAAASCISLYAALSVSARSSSIFHAFAT